MIAESLIADLESQPAGELWAARLAAAESALIADQARPRAILFPIELAPTTADAIAEYTWFTARLGPARYGERLAELHGRAVVAHPLLARLLRGIDAIADCEAAAAQLAAPTSELETHAAAHSRAAVAARQRYQIAIARQLAAIEGHELASAARDLLAAEDLAIRLAAAKTRLEEHARAELARAELERRAAARAVRDKTVDRVREAERQAADAAAQAALSASAYRLTRADALVERLEASGLKQIHVGDEEIYDIAHLVSMARGMSLESLARYEAAIAAHERA